jgi:hypothetical protein
MRAGGAVVASGAEPEDRPAGTDGVASCSGRSDLFPGLRSAPFLATMPPAREG